MFFHAILLVVFDHFGQINVGVAFVQSLNKGQFNLRDHQGKSLEYLSATNDVGHIAHALFLSEPHGVADVVHEDSAVSVTNTRKLQRLARHNDAGATF